jgi:cytochrome c biogenesis protein CcmG/thiol:disulfide interchange protein DsbE
VALFEANEADGLAIVAIDVGEPIEDVRDYVQSRRLPYPVAIDVDAKAQAAYGAIGTPTHYFVDPDGVIRDRAFGRLNRVEMERLVASIHPTDHALGTRAAP